MSGKFGSRLSLRKQKFVAEYLTNGNNGTQAAIAAGYKPSDAKSRATKLINRDASVKAELERARKEIAEQMSYDSQQAMTELEKSIKFARETNNATAMVRAVELRMKMAGLLVDKVDMNVSNAPDIMGVLLEARQRADMPVDDDDVIDGEFSEVDDEPREDIFA